MKRSRIIHPWTPGFRTLIDDLWPSPAVNAQIDGRFEPVVFRVEIQCTDKPTPKRPIMRLVVFPKASPYLA